MQSRISPRLSLVISDKVTLDKHLKTSVKASLSLTSDARPAAGNIYIYYCELQSSELPALSWESEQLTRSGLTAAGWRRRRVQTMVTQELHKNVLFYWSWWSFVAHGIECCQKFQQEWYNVAQAINSV